MLGLICCRRRRQNRHGGRAERGVAAGRGTHGVEQSQAWGQAALADQAWRWTTSINQPGAQSASQCPSPAPRHTAAGAVSFHDCSCSSLSTGCTCSCAPFSWDAPGPPQPSQLRTAAVVRTQVCALLWEAYYLGKTGLPLKSSTHSMEMHPRVVQERGYPLPPVMSGRVQDR